MSNSKKAIIFMCISVLAFSLINFVVKSLSGTFNPYQILLFRSMPMVIISFFLIKKQNLSVLGNRKTLLVTRSIICLISILLFYKSIEILDIGVAVSVKYLTPVFAIFVAIIILKNQLNPLNIVTSILAIFSVVLVCSFSYNINVLGITIALLSAFLLSISWVLVSKIGTDDSPVVVVFYLSFFSSFVGGIFSIYYWQGNIFQLEVMPKVLSLGILGYIGQLYSTKAFQIGNPAEVAPFRYFEIIVSIVLGVLFVNETYSVVTLIGSCILILSLMITFVDIDNSGTIDAEDFRMIKEKLDLNNDGVVDFKDLKFYFAQRIETLKKAFSRIFE